MRRLLIWSMGATIREKLARAAPDWEIARFAQPFRGLREGDRLIDAAKRLPFADGAFDAVYARRIVEHLAPDEARIFAGEVRRILAPGGVFRVSVPDTEGLARAYLRAAEKARAEPSPHAARDVEEKRLLLIDQFTRRVPGGEIARRILAGAMSPESVRQAFGDALGARGEVKPGPVPAARPGMRQRVKELARLLAGRRWVTEPHAARESHLWVYDRFSGPKLLRDAGFPTIGLADAGASAIPRWDAWRIDLSDYGVYAFEPSLFIEGVNNAAA